MVKKIRRNQDRKKSAPSQEEIAIREIREMGERMTQFITLRKRIEDRMGNIFHEIPDFESDGHAWVKDGKARCGSSRLKVVSRVFEWRFHERLSQFPEVFLLSPLPSDTSSLDEKDVSNFTGIMRSV